MNIDTDKTLYILVSGGVLPHQSQPSLRPVDGPVVDTKPRSPKELVFEQACQYPEGYDEEKDPYGVYPRNPRFPMLAEAYIGTVDELVENFRTGLLKAVTALQESNKVVGTINDNQQQRLRSVRADARRIQADENTITIPFDFDQGCEKATQHKARIDAEQEKLNAQCQS